MTRDEHLKRDETEFYNRKYDHEEKRRFYLNIRARSREYFIRKLLKNISKRHMDVLELGCGKGDNLILIKKLYPHYAIYGIDLSRAGILIGKEKGPDINFFVGDFTKLKLKKKFDLVLSVETFEHLSEREQQAHFKIITYLLKDGGFLIFTAPNGYRYKRYELANGDFHPFENAQEIGYVTALMGKHLDILDVKTTHFFEPYPKNNSNDFLLKKMYIAFYILFGNMVNDICSHTRRGQDMVILAKKRCV